MGEHDREMIVNMFSIAMRGIFLLLTKGEKETEELRGDLIRALEELGEWRDG